MFALNAGYQHILNYILLGPMFQSAVYEAVKPSLKCTTNWNVPGKPFINLMFSIMHEADFKQTEKPKFCKESYLTSAWSVFQLPKQLRLSNLPANAILSIAAQIRMFYLALTNFSATPVITTVTGCKH